MTDKNNGGPAFPLSTSFVGGGNCGMSLRDWFAGQAIIGIISDTRCNWSGHRMAEEAYSISDAMLKEREK